MRGPFPSTRAVMKDEFEHWPPPRVQDAPCCGNPIEFMEDHFTAWPDGTLGVCVHCGSLLIHHRGRAPEAVRITKEVFRSLDERSQRQLVAMEIARLSDP